MQKPLRNFFKLLSQSKIPTLASGGITETRHDSADASSPQLSHSKLLYVADKEHKCRYLIDTGAAVSVLPKSCANEISGADSLPLVAANNSTIKTYVAPHSRAPAASRANGNGGGLRTYSRIPLHLRGKTPGAADAVIDSTKSKHANIANRGKNFDRPNSAKN